MQPEYAETIMKVARAGVGQAAVAVAMACLAHDGNPNELTVSRLVILTGKSKRSVKRGIHQLLLKGIIEGRRIRHDFQT
jgi:hypothetical protein